MLRFDPKAPTIGLPISSVKTDGKEIYHHYKRILK